MPTQDRHQHEATWLGSQCEVVCLVSWGHLEHLFDLQHAALIFEPRSNRVLSACCKTMLQSGMATSGAKQS